MTSHQASPQAPALPETTAERFEADVVEASRVRPVVVDFWAPWCQPCHQLAPVLESVAARFAGEVDAVKLNIDKAPRIAQRYRIQSIPALTAFRDGAVAREVTGMQSEQSLTGLFAAVAPSEADRCVARAQAAADDSEAERWLSQALESDPAHRDAVVALARRLADRGETQQARGLLGRVVEDAEVARLRAELDLAAAGRGETERARLTADADAGDPQAALELGRALAADGDHAAAIERLLGAVTNPQTREPARQALLEVFAVLGDDHELTKSARPRLASALY
jgi:putative thioredoxin